MFYLTQNQNNFSKLLCSLIRLLLSKKLKNSILNQMKPQVQEYELERLESHNKDKTPAQVYLQQRIKEPYKKHNAYTNDKSCPQIITVLLFILQLIFHSVFVAPQIYQIDNEILNFFFILNYFIMCAVIGHYIYLTSTDPVDSLIVDLNQKETVEKNSKQETVFCIMCQKTVKKTSKHCYDCGRCTEEYDHHCSCLNNCIGLGNYQEFIQLLFFYQIFNVIITIQAIWVVASTPGQNHGGCIFLILLSLVIFLLVLLTLVFHCYLNCYIRKPTFQFFKDQKKRKFEIGDKVEQKQYLGEILGLALKDNKLFYQKLKGERPTGFQQIKS